ncbi:MAG: restriction endonuclease subunit R, partial [Patescibacteria group bacterium]|nr:restriction endonuclease subunit R [Patescibacteria group bacterium]
SKSDFSEIEKQKIVLKALILLTYLRIVANRIKEKDRNLYHLPLLITLVNSVNVDDADLKLFFKELAKIAENEVDEEIFNQSKEELIELLFKNDNLIFPNGDRLKIDEDLIINISYMDVLEMVYNSKSTGNIEVLTIPKSKQEIIFRIKKSDRPFALIKIGDISNWFKGLSNNYEIFESFDNESIFRQINRDDSDINILMGSRAFYEGWDSNRPNIILYINIGVSSQAKKFILQSVGRGVRIEPIKNERKRLENLFKANKVDKENYEKIKDLVSPIETLYIFGTKPEFLTETINSLREISKTEGEIIGKYFEINESIENYPLLVPVYKLAENTLAEKLDNSDNSSIKKYYINEKDLSLIKDYFNYIQDDRILIVNYDIQPKILNFIKNSFNRIDNYYSLNKKGNINRFDLLLTSIVNHFSIIPQEFEKFEKVERGKFIVHFEKIKFSKLEKIEEFLEIIEEIKNIKSREKKIRSLQNKLLKEGIYDK